MFGRWIDKQTSIGKTPQEIKEHLPSMVMSGWFNKFEAHKLHTLFNDGNIDEFVYEWRRLYVDVKMHPRCTVLPPSDFEKGSGDGEVLGFHPHWDAKNYCKRIEVRKNQIYPYGYQPLIDEENMWGGYKKKTKTFSEFGREVSEPRDKKNLRSIHNFFYNFEYTSVPDCKVVSFDTNMLLTMDNDELIEDIPHRTILNHFLDNDSVGCQPIDEYQPTEIDLYWKEIDEEDEKKLSWTKHSVWENKLLSYQETLREGERLYGY